MMADNLKSVLVTGATGFVGRRLCDGLRRAGYRVVAVGRRAEAGPWDHFLVIDLARHAVPVSEMEGVWGIFHVAGLAHVTLAAHGENPYWPLSVKATERLLEAAQKAGVPRFLFMSSVKAMGEGNPVEGPLRPMDEATCHTCLGPYGAAKREGEQLVLRSGLPHPVVLRPAMVFGPGGRGNLPKMREAVRRHRFPPLPETGNRRSMVHVDDLVEIALRTMERPVAAGKTYIVCHSQAVSTRQLYDALRERLGLSPISYAIPMALLRAAATVGTVVSRVTGKTLPLDREVLRKLTGSAWYRADLVERELGYAARHSVLDWVRQDSD
jgi:UDP-glucose 4-epimerase